MLTERPNGGRRHRVLLADDDPAIRSLVRARLELHPELVVVGEAGDGREAVRLVEALAPEVVVLDLEMPRMGGAEAIPLLRAAAPGVAIVMFSAAGRTRLDAAVGAAPPDAVVEKGAPLTRLVATVLESAAHVPFDLVRVDLGHLRRADAVAAFDALVGVNMGVLDAIDRGEALTRSQCAGATADELVALVGLFGELATTLHAAAGRDDDEASLVVHLARGTAEHAARAAAASLEAGRLEDFFAAWGRPLDRAELLPIRRTVEVLLAALWADAPAPRPHDRRAAESSNPRVVRSHRAPVDALGRRATELMSALGLLVVPDAPRPEVDGALLAATHLIQDLVLHAHNLEVALESRIVIEQAKGLLMAEGGSADQAFAELRRRSQSTNRKLRDVAADLVERRVADDPASRQR